MDKLLCNHARRPLPVLTDDWHRALDSEKLARPRGTPAGFDKPVRVKHQKITRQKTQPLCRIPIPRDDTKGRIAVPQLKAESLLGRAVEWVRVARVDERALSAMLVIEQIHKRDKHARLD